MITFLLHQRHTGRVGPAALLLSAAVLALAAAPAAARGEAGVQDGAGERSAEANTRRVFLPEDFARFAPRNALDMAEQIPGFSIRSNDGVPPW